MGEDVPADHSRRSAARARLLLLGRPSPGARRPSRRP
jgi:hypothetical protein